MADDTPSSVAVAAAEAFALSVGLAMLIASISTDAAGG